MQQDERRPGPHRVVGDVDPVGAERRHDPESSPERAPTIVDMADDEAAPATRLERDSMGEMAVPLDALYGASTQRAVLNFPISGQRFPRRFIRALALIKLAAAETNAELGLLDAEVGAAIAAAAREVADGAHDDQFPIDIYQTGSGTSTNTNMNEVVAHLAAARLGDGRIGPPERRRQPLPVQQRHDPDGPPAVGRDGHRGRAHPRPGAPAHGPRRARSRRCGRSSRPAGRTSRTPPRSGWARSSGATPARSRSRSDAPGPPRPSCSRSRSAGRPSGQASTPTRSTPSGRAPACRG